MMGEPPRGRRGRRGRRDVAALASGTADDERGVRRRRHTTV